ncbi:MAG: hypothetical protein SNJ55_09155 [Chloroherpetonaceae bacterium]
MIYGIGGFNATRKSNAVVASALAAFLLAGEDVTVDNNFLARLISGDILIS